MEDSNLTVRPQAVNVLKDLIFELSMGVSSNGFPGLVGKEVRGNNKAIEQEPVCWLQGKEKVTGGLDGFM